MPQPGYSRSPFQEGFAALRDEPLLLPAELAWRWSFALAAWLIALYAAALFLDSLTPSALGRLSLDFLRPALGRLPRAHSFDAVLVRYLWIKFVVLAALTFLWSFAAAPGRAASLHNLIGLSGGEDRDEAAGWQFRPMFQLHLLRALWTWIALACFLSSFPLGHTFMAAGRSARGAFFYVFGVALSCVFGVMLNWLFGLAPLFCIRNQTNAREAMAFTLGFCTRQGSRLFGLSLAFLAIRLVWFGSMFLLVFAPTSLGKHVAIGWQLLMMFTLFLIYLAGADALYLARLGAYAALAEIDSQPTPVPEPQPWTPYVPSSQQLATGD
ncbi:MAG TPA: hypothetical protein VE779_11600 [Candidatus Angelobacter sp.]|nr:hypothetical protein [Candidatus Angelobacter sp.]